MRFDLRFKIVVPLLILGLFLIGYATSDHKKWGTRKITMIGVFTAMAIVIGMVESMLPDLFVPGMKLGLANVIILIMLYEFSWSEALMVDILRVVAVSLLRGTLFSMGGWMSFAGMVLSYLGMAFCVLASKRKLTPFFVSILGALLHDVGQIAIGILYLGSTAVLYYLPFMALISLATGLFSGFLCRLILKSKILEKSRKLYEGEENK